MYSLSVKEVQEIVFNHNLLREVVEGNEWYFRLEDPNVLDQSFTTLTYNSKETNASTLFFCKGQAFERTYLEEAVNRGVTYYISEELYDIPNTVGIIVSDIRKAMALVARAFYDFPEKKIKMIGITGTKGKTTTTFLTHYIMNQKSPEKTAVISTIGNKLDGQHWLKSTLTTPESLDLFQLIAQAVENQMEYLVMEVSSQAFRLDRVYGLTFDIGVFLNISPDHIGPNEHPHMEDYFYCKRQLISVCKIAVVNDTSEHSSLLLKQADYYSDSLVTYSMDGLESDYTVKRLVDNPHAFSVVSRVEDELDIEDDYTIMIPGNFNKENALCAMIISRMLGASKDNIKRGLESAVVPGRMEYFAMNEDTHIYVDFAHNYISLKSVLDFAQGEHPNHHLTVVLGAPGGKGHSRRQNFGELLSLYEGTVVLTADDPNTEDPRDISREIAQHITGNMSVKMIDDRQEAIEWALSQAGDKGTVIIAGKGNDEYMIVKDKKESYVGDPAIVEAFIKKQL